LKKLLITDRYSESSKQSLMKIRKSLSLHKSAELTVTEIMPWIRIELRFDEKKHEAQSLIQKLREHQMMAAEV
jgi:hypothetical protein